MRADKNIVLLIAIFVLAGCSATDHALLAKSHYEANRFDDAIESAKRATEINPGYAPGWYWLGMAYLEKKQWDDTITALEKVVRLNPSPAQLSSSYKWLGYAYNEKGRYEVAIVALKRAIELHPENEQAVLYHNLGHAYAEKGEFDQAIQAFRRALALGVPDKQLTTNLLRSATLAKHLRPARTAQADGNYPAAWTAYRRVLSLHPKNPTLYAEAASLLLDVCDPDGAIRLLEEGLKRVPNDWGLRRWLGLAYGQKGDRARAREYRGLASAWFALIDQSGEVRIQRVFQNGPAARSDLHPGDQILQVEGAPAQDAKQVFARVEQHEPGSSISLRIRRGDRVFDTSVTLGSVVDRYWPVNPAACKAQALNREGVALAREQKLIGALSKFEEALQVGLGVVPKAHYNAALVLEQIGRPHDALSHYVAAHREFVRPEDEIDTLTQVVALTQRARIPVPDSADRRYRLGILRAQQKRYQDAVQEFEAALAEAPWLVDAYYNLGLVYDFMEAYPDALRVLMIYAKLAPAAPNIGPVKSKIVELEDRFESTDQKGSN